jgi:hypothetical protein
MKIFSTLREKKMSVRNIGHCKAIIVIESSDRDLPRLVMNGYEYNDFVMIRVLLEYNDKICEKAIVDLDESFYITFTDKKWYIRSYSKSEANKSITPILSQEKTNLILTMIMAACKEYQISLKFDINIDKVVEGNICVERDYPIRNESLVFFRFTNLFADENGNFTESRFIDGQWYSNTKNDFYNDENN